MSRHIHLAGFCMLSAKKHKQSSGGGLQKFRRIHRKELVKWILFWQVLFYQVLTLQSASLLKSRFPMSFTSFFKKAILEGWLAGCFWRALWLAASGDYCRIPLNNCFCQNWLYLIEIMRYIKILLIFCQKELLIAKFNLR